MHRKSVLLKPTAEVWFLALAFPMKEATQDYVLVQNQACICRKHHIRQAGLRCYEFDCRFTSEDLTEPPPLFSCEPDSCAVYIAFHPWVDDIINLVKLRRTHEETVGYIH